MWNDDAVVELRRALARGLRKALQDVGVRQKLQAIVGHCINVPHRGQEAGGSVHNDLRQAPHIRCNNGHAARHGLEGHQPEALRLAGQEEQVRRAEERSHVIHHPDVAHCLYQPQGFDELTRLSVFRPVSNQDEPRIHFLPHPGEDAHHVPQPFQGPEVRDVHEGDLSVRGLFWNAGDRVGVMSRRVHEVIDDVDLFPDGELAVGLIPQICGDRGHGIGLFDGELHDGLEGRTGADQGDVGAMQRGDDFQVQLRRDLPGQDGGRGKRNGVVDVHDLQLVGAGHLHHLCREGQAVRELLQEGMIVLVHLVVTDAGRQLAQPQRVRVADERNRMAPFCQVLAQLGGHHAASPGGRVAADTDSHATFLPAECHSGWGCGKSCSPAGRFR